VYEKQNQYLKTAELFFSLPNIHMLWLAVADKEGILLETPIFVIRKS
jgi:hypothetical protein